MRQMPARGRQQEQGKAARTPAPPLHCLARSAWSAGARCVHARGCRGRGGDSEQESLCCFQCTAWRCQSAVQAQGALWRV